MRYATISGGVSVSRQWQKGHGLFVVDTGPPCDTRTHRPEVGSLRISLWTALGIVGKPSSAQRHPPTERYTHAFQPRRPTDSPARRADRTCRTANLLKHDPGFGDENRSGEARAQTRRRSLHLHGTRSTGLSGEVPSATTALRVVWLQYEQVLSLRSRWGCRTSASRGRIGVGWERSEGIPWGRCRLCNIAHIGGIGGFHRKMGYASARNPFTCVVAGAGFEPATFRL